MRALSTILSACALLAASGATVEAAPDAHSADHPASPPAKPAGADALSGASLDFSAMRAPESERERSFSADALPAREEDFWIAFEDTGADEDVLRQSLAPLVGLLRQRHPDRRVVLTRIPSSTFAEEVKRRRIPFVMSTSGTMVALMQVADVVPFASRGGDAGALLLVRREDALLRLPDLRGSTLAYADAAVFGHKAWLDMRIRSETGDEKHFWAALERRARSLPDVLAPLALGRVDAALLPGCLWERITASGLVDSERFVPVGAENESGRCLSSTPRYPDWMLGYAPVASDESLRSLAAVVFDAKGRGTDRGAHWNARVDLADVRAAMEALELGPWSHVNEESLKRLLERHKDKAALALLLLLALVLHSLRANHLVRVRTAALTEALRARDRSEEEAKKGRERLSAMERAGILSQMSGMFAHELKQPLAAVRNYVGGLKLRQKMSKNPDPVTLEVLNSIDEEAARAAGIVERVRGYAKANARAHGPTDLAAALRRAVDYARRHDSSCAPVWVVPEGALAARPEEDERVSVWGDALELELLVLNLVRNASHAAAAQNAEEPVVRVCLRREGERAILTIEDNGAPLTDAAFERLTGLGDSVKSEGLGIGLSICRGIADRHGAALRFSRRSPQGVAARFTIPLWDGEEAPQNTGAAHDTHQTHKTNSEGTP